MNDSSLPRPFAQRLTVPEHTQETVGHDGHGGAVDGEAHAEHEDGDRADDVQQPESGAGEFERGVVDPVLMIMSHGFISLLWR